MKQKSKYFKEVSTQFNTNDKYTDKQIEFYSKIPDVTRILMYSVFEDILNTSDDDDYKNMISPKGFVTRFGLGYSENLSITLGGLYLKLQEGGYLLGTTSHGLLHEDMFLKKGFFGENLIEISLFWNEVNLIKPKYNWNDYEKVIKKYGYDKHLVFDGKEHPYKFSSDSPFDYTLFLLGKKSKNPISKTTKSIGKGIRILEKMMLINPNGDFNDYIMTDVNSYYKAKNNLIKLAKVPRINMKSS